MAVTAHGTTPVAFEISCSATGVQITTTTSGLDLDLNGYGVDVDGTHRGLITPTGTMLGPARSGKQDHRPDGPRTELQGHRFRCPHRDHRGQKACADRFRGGLHRNERSNRVLVRPRDPMSAGSLTLVWTELAQSASGRRRLTTGPGCPPVTMSSHCVSPNCLVDRVPQPATVTAGGLTVDTVEVAVSVTCMLRPGPTGTVRISALTTGPMPSSTRYHVYYAHDGYWDYAGGFWIRLGDLNPNGTLVAELPASDPGGLIPTGTSLS